MDTKKDKAQIFRLHGLRFTKTRQALMELLSAGSTPLSVPQILSGLQKMGVVVNKTTVYRELDRLETLGIVGAVQLHERTKSYEIVSSLHHHHLVCIECKRVEDIDMDEEDLSVQVKQAAIEKQFTVLRHSLEFFGLCQKCRA